MQRKQDLVNALERIQKDLDSDRLKNNDELTSLRSDYQETNQELVRLNAILADRDAIEGAAAKEKELTATIEGLTIEIDKLTEQGAGHQELIHDMENAIRDLEGSVHALSDDLVLRQYKEAIREQDAAIRETEQFIKAIETDAHIIRLESDINNLEEKASILDLKDPSCQSKTCAFITNALTAAERLPVLKKTLASLKVRQAENIAAAREKLDGLNEHFKDLTNREIERIAFIEEEKGKIELKIAEAESKIKAEKLLSTTRSVSIDIRRKNLSDAKSELNQQKALSARLSEIQVAEQRSEDVVKRLDEITQKGIDARKAFEVRELEAKRLISEHQEAITGIDEKIDQDADVKLSGYQKEMNAIETDLIPVIDKEIQETREKSAKIQGELSRIEDAEKELATVQAEKERLTREISEWAYLRNACSKNGLQALEIDGAAPLITGYANDLLSQAFGPLFTVRLRTQDDEGKEVLDIVVIMDDGSEVLLDNLSGGQKIWILMALRLAMTLLSKEKSGRNFETALFDEIDGPLDPDNSVNFIAMYQAFMKTGGFTTIPFISHKPECRSMADNILRFEPGKNPVWG
ncbi:MAG: hypothetical protein A4E66_02156 [Syntrophus sp. PtaB.Bin001]|nr:MAG: hypothetical protein A4E66_02156 [Syntrophus sp. PtaB.Bin001]